MFTYCILKHLLTFSVLLLNLKQNAFLIKSCLLLFQVQDTSFILCIVVIQPEIPVRQLKNLNTVPSSKLLYHRLDLLGQPNACLHFKQLATLGKVFLFLKSVPPFLMKVQLALISYQNPCLSIFEILSSRISIISG